MQKTIPHSLKYLLTGSLLLLLLLTGAKMISYEPENPESKVPLYAQIPYDTPLDAVKWTGGFWQERMESLRNIYFPGTLDGSFMELTNGASMRNFLRAAGMEEGGAVARSWSDGDCYLLFDVASRLYSYKPDEYLKKKLDYWIPVFAKVQRDDGFIDSWTILKDFDSRYAKYWEKYEGGARNRGKLQGGHRYNFGHLIVTENTYKKVFKDDKFQAITDKSLEYYKDKWPVITNGLVGLATASLYEASGDTFYLNILKRCFSDRSSVFGPPFREAEEVFGHNCETAHELIGGTLQYNFTGEKVMLDALHRLAGNMLSSKVFITGAVAPVQRGQRPEQTVNGMIYKARPIAEGIGKSYELPNDSSYCESCGQCLYMEFFYRMFRLTSEIRYMDAVERSMYNSVPGCVDINKANYFYCNPQEQGPGSKRRLESEPDVTNDGNYTWKRAYIKKCACCPAKIMRALAMSAEIAYSVSEEGLWVNLYGSNTYNTKLPWGGTLECQQTTNYPWDGKVKLVLSAVKSKNPFSVFLRIPGWVNTPVSISLNGKVIEKAVKGGTYYSLKRKWKNGDRLEMEMAMPVRIMAADPRIADDRGKVAVMRGPVVYCLEDQDIPKGLKLDSLFFTGAANLKPVSTEELGGVTKLTGSMIYKTNILKPVDTAKDFKPENGLYQEIRLENNMKSGSDVHSVNVSLIPYYARLNRESNYFKIWLPVLQ